MEKTSQKANPSYQNRIMTEAIRQQQFIIVLIYRSTLKLSTTERKQSESENCKEKQNSPKKANPSYRNKEGGKRRKWVQSSIPGMASHYLSNTTTTSQVTGMFTETSPKCQVNWTQARYPAV